MYQIILRNRIVCIMKCINLINGRTLSIIELILWKFIPFEFSWIRESFLSLEELSISMTIGYLSGFWWVDFNLINTNITKLWLGSQSLILKTIYQVFFFKYKGFRLTLYSELIYLYLLAFLSCTFRFIFYRLF